METISRSFDDDYVSDDAPPRHDLSDTTRCEIASAGDEGGVDSGSFEKPEDRGEVAFPARLDHERVIQEKCRQFV
ncbi:hypothetical protein [Streptomyces sp. NPDC003077]|uniref:hypothetical protein n=1 Tax=Streptomyces sp. NPDC003077 TaxID=3154443 RepID=UPI0033A45AA7